VFHSIFRPGSTHKKHLHSRCDEIAVYLKGHGVVGQREGRAEVRAGHCRLMPRGAEHFFYNETEDEDALVVGFYIGAKDVADTGYQYCGEVTEQDLKMPRNGFPDGILVHLDDVKPEKMDQGQGWSITDFRLPLGRHNGSSTTLFRARFFPGAVHKKHRHDNCEEIYFVISGHGLAGAGPDRVEVRGGHFHYIPKGVEHWLHNLSPTEPIEVVGIYIGAGNVAETGYVYMGDVTAEDLHARTV
jgi:mannose-6-phosphate isomerase-like protein (cupin superfamily)